MVLRPLCLWGCLPSRLLFTHPMGALCCEVPFGKAAQQPRELLFLNLPSMHKVLLIPLLAVAKSCSKVLNSLITTRGT